MVAPRHTASKALGSSGLDFGYAWCFGIRACDLLFTVILVVCEKFVLRRLGQGSAVSGY